MNIKCYILSLDKSQDLVSQSSKYFDNVEVVKGIHYKNLTNDQIITNTLSPYTHFIPKSGIAIAMGHLKIWKKFVKDGGDYACIFEDDAIINDNLNVLDDILSNTPKTFDILYIGYLFGQNDYNIVKLLYGIVYGQNKDVYVNEHVKIPSLSLGCHGYILSRKGAIKLINLIENNIYNHVDVMINGYKMNNKVEVYSINKPLMYQSSTENYMSSGNCSKHPKMINKALSKIYIEDHVTLGYCLTCNFMRIGDININGITIVFLLLGIVLYNYNSDYNVKLFLTIFIMLSMYDVLYTEIDIDMFVNFAILFLPVFTKNYLNKEKEILKF